MDEQREAAAPVDQATSDAGAEPQRLPWIAPRFETIRFEDAKGGAVGVISDGNSLS